MDPTDSTTIPPEVRQRALEAALEAVADVLADAGLRLDYLARCELLDMELQAMAEGFEAPGPKTN
jgi:hypothetical protein